MSEGKYMERKSDEAIIRMDENIKIMVEDIKEIKITHSKMWIKIGEHTTAIEVVKVKSSILGTLAGFLGGFLARFLKPF